MRLLVIALAILRTFASRSIRNGIADDESAAVALPSPALILVLAQPLGLLNDLYPSTSKEESTEELSWIPFEEDIVQTVDNDIDMSTLRFMRPTEKKVDHLPSSNRPCPSTSSICSTAAHDLSSHGAIDELESSRFVFRSSSLVNESKLCDLSVAKTCLRESRETTEQRGAGNIEHRIEMNDESQDDCRCCWCSRPANNRDDGSSNSRDANFHHRPSYGGPTPQQQRDPPPSDYARTFAPSAPFTPGGNDARRRDFGRPFAPSEFPPYARLAYDAAPRAPRDLAPPPYAQVNGHPIGQQQWPSYSSAPVFNPFPRAHPAPQPHPPPPRAGIPYGPTPPVDRDQSGFGPLQSRLSQGGMMRGTGTFARALQMKSPFPWMRNWMTESSRLRHGMLGLNSRYNQ